VNGGTVTIEERTLFERNTAPTGNGSTIYVSPNGEVRYVLPAPPGRWINIAQGTVFRFQPGSELSLDFPYFCPAGVVGGVLESEQTGPGCKQPCPAGSLCAAGSTVPSHCPMGSYCPRGVPAAILCPAGTFSNAEDLTSVEGCQTCTTGHVCPLGSVTPIPCPIGKYAELSGATSIEACSACPLHMTTLHLGATGLTQCICASGRVPLAGGVCGCPAGFRYERGTADTCEPCPSGLSSAPGSSSCDLCAAGRYLAFGQTASAANCILCPPGAFCETNTTVETLKILHGYWRLTTLTSKISACAKTASAGDPPACKGGTAGAATCAANHTGPLCEVCLQDHQYFNDGACRNCPPADNGIIVAVAVLLSLLLPVGIFIFVYQQHSPKLWWISVPLRVGMHRAQILMSKFGLVPKVKLLLSFAQVVASLDSTYNVGLPESWFEWTNFLRFLGEVDWTGWMIPTACIVGNDMIRYLLLRSLAPLVLILIAPLAGAALSWTFRRNRRDNSPGGWHRLADWLPVSLFLTFCFTPSVSSTIFRAWHCVSFPFNDFGEERSFLAQDMSVSCDESEEYSRVLLVAWILVTIWPVGMVLTYAALLFPLRNDFHEEELQLPIVHATAFLHRDYKPAYFWWEVVSLLQRTVLTGWLLLIDDDLQFLRLFAAVVFSNAFLVLLLSCSPYKRLLDHALAVCCQILLVCMFLCGLLVRLFEDISNDVAGSQALAYRMLGLKSSEEAVVIMIIIAFCMVVCSLSHFWAKYTYTSSRLVVTPSTLFAR